MNWEALGAFSELVAALAVVITLIFLIKEIRQNSQVVQVAALRDATSQWNHWSNMLASTPDLAAIVVEGNKSYRDLAAEDALRYGAFVQTFFDNASSYRELVIDHHVEDDLDILETIVRRRIIHKGFREWWRENFPDYNQDFIDWTENILKDQAST